VKAAGEAINPSWLHFLSIKSVDRTRYLTITTSFLQITLCRWAPAETYSHLLKMSWTIPISASVSTRRSSRARTRRATKMKLIYKKLRRKCAPLTLKFYFSALWTTIWSRKEMRPTNGCLKRLKRLRIHDTSRNGWPKRTWLLSRTFTRNQTCATTIICLRSFTRIPISSSRLCRTGFKSVLRMKLRKKRKSCPNGAKDASKTSQKVLITCLSFSSRYKRASPESRPLKTRLSVWRFKIQRTSPWTS